MQILRFRLQIFGKQHPHRTPVLANRRRKELPKTTAIEKMTKEEAVAMIEAKTPKKKTTKRT